MKTIEEKLNSGREYRGMQLSVFENETEEQKEMVVEGYATTFGEPYLLINDKEYSVYETISKNAFDSCNMDDVVLQYDHTGHVYCRTRNGSLKLRIDPDKGLHVEAYLGGTEIGRQLYEEIKQGYSDKMSFGFKVAEDERKVIEDENGHITIHRTITKIERLFDVSVVSIPANDNTDIHVRNYFNGVIEAAKTERFLKERAKKALLLKIKLLEV